MRVICENCSAAFNLDETLVKRTGSKVRCSKCKHVFVVYPPKPAEEPVPEPEAVSLSPADEPEAASGEGVDAEASQAADESAGALFGETAMDEPATDDLDLSDIEKMLETETSTKEAASETGSIPDGTEAESAEDSLDLSDIEKILDEEDEGEELLEDKGSGDQDLEFDLDEDFEIEAGEDQISPTAELDLGDLEKMFESEEAPDLSLEEDASLSLDLEGDDDLSLMTDTAKSEDIGELKLEMEETPAAPEPETESGEPLDFDFEPAQEDEKKEEFQIPDLDLKIETDEPEEAPETVADIADLGIELEMERGPEDFSTETPPEEPAAEVPDAPDAIAEQLDMLIPGGADEPAEPAETTEPAAEVSEVPAESLKKETAGDDGLGDLDEDAEIDFPDDAVPEIPDEDEFEGEVEPPAEEPEEEAEDIEEDAAASAGSGNLLKIILAAVIVIIVAAAVLVTLQIKGIVDIPYLSEVQLPFIGKLGPSTPLDFGEEHIIPSDVEGRFLEGKTGRLFIVTGNVKNEYPQARSYIQVSVTLKGKDQAQVRTVSAYCGNVIADLELAQMSAAQIRARMDNRPGDNNANVGIKPGEERPFMIVFSDLPKSMKEYSVHVIGSSAAQ